MLEQLFVSQGGDLLASIINLLSMAFLFVLIFFSSRLMATQITLKLEKDAVELELMAIKSREKVSKAISKKPALVKDKIRKFMDFFIVSPVDTDPYGIIRKIDLVSRQSDSRFKLFVKQINPSLDAEKSANMRNALAGAMAVHQIAKVVRHFLELIKKYKMYQFAFIVQMQIPLIKRIANAASAATDAFIEGTPIGDGIGPLVVAHLMKGKPDVYSDDEFVVTKAKIATRTVFVAKAFGPGASTGYPGKFLTKFVKKQSIDRIITVDAGMRMEGEKPGSIAEGVGVAMGGTGVDRYEIEQFAVANDVPIDAIVIKVNEEEALSHMPKEILASVHGALATVEEAVKRGKRTEKILLVGVGNTCGVGNDSASVRKAEEKIKAAAQKVKPKKKKGLFW